MLPCCLNQNQTLPTMMMDADTFMVKAYYMDVPTLLKTCSLSRYTQNLCNDNFWYNYWLKHPGSYDQRGQYISRMLEGSMDDRINKSFFRGTLRRGFDLKNKLALCLKNRHYTAMRLLLDRGAPIDQEVVGRIADNIRLLLDTPLTTITAYSPLLVLFSYMTRRQKGWTIFYLTRYGRSEDVEMYIKNRLIFIQRNRNLLDLDIELSRVFIEGVYTEALVKKQIMTTVEGVELITRFLEGVYTLYPDSTFFDNIKHYTSYIYYLYYVLDTPLNTTYYSNKVKKWFVNVAPPMTV